MAGETAKPQGEDLKADPEIDQYIRALGVSSSRVRFVMLAVIVASVAAAATLWGERGDAWARDRLQAVSNFHAIATRCKTWDHFSHALGCARDLKQNKLLGGGRLNAQQKRAKEDIVSWRNPTDRSCIDECAAANFFQGYGINTEAGAKAFEEQQWNAFVNNILYVKTPVLGLTFDINDLGLIAGGTFAILMLVMVFYTHRAHENLFLAMWKVRELATKGNCFDQPGSKANLLYHALAMEQVFTVPPTLARWNDRPIFRKAHYVLFLIPVVVQGFILANDIHSAAIGMDFSNRQTMISLFGQAFLILVVGTFCALCCGHLHADDTLWDQTFFIINPSYRWKGKARWIHWVRLLHHEPPGWGIVGKQEDKSYQLFLTDTVWKVVWKLDASTETLLKYDLTNAHGLYLAKDESIHLYHFSRRDKRAALKSTAKDDHQKITWPREEGMTSEGRFEVLAKLDTGDGHHFHISRKRIRKVDGLGNRAWEVGNNSYQVDSDAGEPGFNRIHAIFLADKNLFVTDGAWLRAVNADGVVTTWGGRPLGEVLRRERPFILGMTPTSNSSELLVCDFSLGRVLKVGKDSVREDYRSEPGWSPTGIWTHQQDIYLLEYREDTIRRRLLNWMGFGAHIRILQFQNDLSGKPTKTILVSHGKAKSALRKSTVQPQQAPAIPAQHPTKAMAQLPGEPRLPQTGVRPQGD
jgi:hypothetical protein